MSRSLEPTITAAWHEAHGHGTLILEFPLVRRSPTSSHRFIDGIAARIPAGDAPRHDAVKAVEEGHASDIVAIETQRGRLSLGHIGQITCAAALMRRRGLTVRPVLICEARDEACETALADLDRTVEVWIATPLAGADRFAFQRVAP